MHVPRTFDAWPNSLLRSSCPQVFTGGSSFPTDRSLFQGAEVRLAKTAGRSHDTVTVGTERTEREWEVVMWGDTENAQLDSRRRCTSHRAVSTCVRPVEPLEEG